MWAWERFYWTCCPEGYILLHTTAKSECNSVTCDLPVDLDQIAAEQRLDTECQELSVKMGNQKITDIKRTYNVFKNEVLFRSVPDAKEGQRLQIVIPTSLKKFILTYAHDNPLNGHLSKFKTLMRLLEFAYWATIRNDV